MTMSPAKTHAKPTAAFILALLGGLWMLASGLWGGGWDWRGMHGGGWGWAGGCALSRGTVCNWMAGYGWWPWVGLIAGLAIVTAATLLYARPEQRTGWGIAILLAAIIGFSFGADGLLAAVLAAVGGVLALVWQPPPSAGGLAESSQN
jgi:hypothetical protein